MPVTDMVNGRGDFILVQVVVPDMKNAARASSVAFVTESIVFPVILVSVISLDLRLGLKSPTPLRISELLSNLGPSQPYGVRDPYAFILCFMNQLKYFFA